MDVLLLNAGATAIAVYAADRLVTSFTPIFIQKKLYGAKSF